MTARQNLLFFLLSITFATGVKCAENEANKPNSQVCLRDMAELENLIREEILKYLRQLFHEDNENLRHILLINESHGGDSEGGYTWENRNDQLGAREILLTHRTNRNPAEISGGDNSSGNINIKYPPSFDSTFENNMENNRINSAAAVTSQRNYRPDSSSQIVSSSSSENGNPKITSTSQFPLLNEAGRNYYLNTEQSSNGGGAGTGVGSGGGWGGYELLSGGNRNAQGGWYTLRGGRAGALRGSRIEQLQPMGPWGAAWGLGRGSGGADQFGFGTGRGGSWYGAGRGGLGGARSEGGLGAWTGRGTGYGDWMGVGSGRGTGYGDWMGAGSERGVGNGDWMGTGMGRGSEGGTGAWAGRGTGTGFGDWMGAGSGRGIGTGSDGVIGGVSGAGAGVGSGTETGGGRSSPVTGTGSGMRLDYGPGAETWGTRFEQYGRDAAAAAAGGRYPSGMASGNGSSGRTNSISVSGAQGGGGSANGVVSSVRTGGGEAGLSADSAQRAKQYRVVILNDKTNLPSGIKMGGSGSNGASQQNGVSTTSVQSGSIIPGSISGTGSSSGVNAAAASNSGSATRIGLPSGMQTTQSSQGPSVSQTIHESVANIPGVSAVTGADLTGSGSTRVIRMVPFSRIVN